MSTFSLDPITVEYCDYSFTSTSDDCSLVSTNETLGRLFVVEHVNRGILFRTKGQPETAYNIALEDYTIQGEWLNSNGNPITGSLTEQQIADTVVEARVTIRDDGGNVVFSFAASQTATYDTDTDNFTWVNNPYSTIKAQLNGSSVPIGIADDDGDYPLLQTPTHIPRFEASLDGITGRYSIPVQTLRSGLTAMLNIENSQNPDIESDGRFLSTNTILTLTEDCVWEVMKTY